MMEPGYRLAPLPCMIARSCLAVLSLLLASCTTAQPEPLRSLAPPLSCRDSQNGDDGPSPDLEVVLDAAALPTTRALQVNDAGDGWLFAKVGLFVRPHLTVELSIEPDVDAAVEYGPGERSRRVVLPQCTVLPDRWIVYTGGYYVRKPACVPVRLRAKASEALVRIPVGAACQST
jgi:hypothetical protein